MLIETQVLNNDNYIEKLKIYIYLFLSITYQIDETGHFYICLTVIFWPEN